GVGVGDGIVTRRAPMRDIDRLLAKAQDLLDQAWRTAQTKREIIALVDAYHDVRRARANLHLALTPQPVKYRPPSRSKLTPEQVREIRARWEAGGVTQAQLAEEYGVHLKHMQHIIRGRVWKGAAWPPGSSSPTCSTDSPPSRMGR